MTRTTVFLFFYSATFCSLSLVRALDEGTLCGLPRCTNLLNPLDGCGDGCNRTEACDSFNHCIDTGAGRGGCRQSEHCVTAEYDEQVKGEDYCDCLFEDVLDCFSSVSTVEVENKGKTLIKDIQVGDKILTGSMEYKPVYTMDHKNPWKPTNFVQIRSTGNDSPIEMTESHLVFLHGQEHPIPASAVKVGDALRAVDHSPSTVTDISIIKRTGLWNPITTDGTIVVDGIVASTYNVPFKNNNNKEAHVEVTGLKLVSHHDFLHLLMSPYRALCLGISLSYCEAKHEYNIYSWLGSVVMKVYHQQGDLVQNLMVLSFLITFQLLGFILNPLVVATIVSVIYCLGVKKKKKLKSRAKLQM